VRSKYRWLRTRPARTTLAEDLQRQAKGADGTTSTRPARAAQEIRAQATAKSRAIKASQVASRLIARAMGIQVQASELCDSLDTYMTTELTRARVDAVNEMHRGSSRFGHLVPWLPALAVQLLMIVMIANDPAFIIVVLRHAMDLPDSIGIWRLYNPSVLVSTLAGIGTSVILLSCAYTGGKAIARLIFVSRLDRIDSEHPELMRSAKLISKPRAAVIACLALLPLAFSTVILHGFAESRFRASQNTFGVLTGGVDDAVATYLVLLIAFLPTIVLLLEIIAAVPAFEHARRTRRSAISLRIRQVRSIRKESRLARRYARRFGRAQKAFDLLRDVIDHVGMAADAEYVEAGISTALIEVPGEAIRESPNTSGAPASRYLPDLPVASNTVASVYEAWYALRPPSEHRILEASWRELRQNPKDFARTRAREKDVLRPSSNGHKPTTNRSMTPPPPVPQPN
jgi:hypothetical protein